MTLIRIVHVLQKMNRAGAETWLMHVLRNIDRTRFQMDFLVHAEEPGAYDEEIRALGSEVIHCAGSQRPWEYARNFRHIAREHGPYDIVHSHVQYYNGLVLLLARLNGIPNRIAHSHLDTSWEDSEASVGRKAYIAAMTLLIRQHATERLAASRPAAASLFGQHWHERENAQILYCGIDMARFAPDTASPVSRAALGLPEHARVIGHIGRFDPQKNHAFVLETARLLVDRDLRIHVLLIGDGARRPVIERRIEQLNLAHHVHLLGSRGDVADLLNGAVDMVILPSTQEGLPLVAMEAQAAGLPLILSDKVTSEAILVPELVTQLPIQHPSAWADAIQRELGQPRSVEERRVMHARASAGRFSIHHSVRELEALYGAMASRN